VFKGLLRSAPKVFTGTPHVFSKVLASAHNAAMLDVVAHAFAGSAHLRPALLHLSFGCVVILLSHSRQRGQG
jgi:hypothetical protein